MTRKELYLEYVQLFFTSQKEHVILRRLILKELVQQGTANLSGFAVKVCLMNKLFNRGKSNGKNEAYWPDPTTTNIEH